MLKPCPFCGAQPVYKTERDMLPPYNSRAWIKCPQCRQAQVCSDWYGGDLGTTEVCWNKRFDEPYKHPELYLHDSVTTTQGDVRDPSTWKTTKQYPTQNRDGE